MALYTWVIYLVATMALSLTPGPYTLLALTHNAVVGDLIDYAGPRLWQ